MRSLLWVVVMGIAARIALAAMNPSGLQRLEPSVIAENLNAGRGFTFEQYGTVYRALKEPLYIVLLATLVRLVGEQDVVLVVLQGIFGIAAALGVAWVAHLILGDPRKAALAGAIAAANPFLVYYDTHFIHPLSLDSLLFVAATGTTLWAVGARAGQLRAALVVGVVTGLALWQRATILAAGVGSWVAAIATARVDGRRRVAQQAVVWGCVAGMVIAPWLLRNYRLFGRLIVTTDSTHILWLGNNPWSNGTYSDLAGQRVFFSAAPQFQRRITAASELEQHDLFLAEVRRFVREHPGQFGNLVLRKLWAFVWFSPNAGIMYRPIDRLLYRIAYGGLLLLGLLGLIRCWRRTSRAEHMRIAVLLGAVAGVAVLHALTAVNLKHRVPLELVLAVFASESLWAGLTWMRAPRRGTPATSVL